MYSSQQNQNRISAQNNQQSHPPIKSLQSSDNKSLCINNNTKAQMEQSTVLAILKCVFIVLFIAIVIIVGLLPLRMSTFKKNKFLKAMGTTFAGALFINVAIIHILPQSADAIQRYLKEQYGSDQVFPLANLLVMLGFLVTVLFTRIISTHTHHEEHEDEHQQHQPSGHQRQRQNQEHGGGRSQQAERGHGHLRRHMHRHQPSKNKTQAAEGVSSDSLLANSSLLTDLEPKQQQLTKQKDDQDAYFLTLAMYFHTIFEGIAIGVQNTIGGFLSTAIAIAFHKWADALSMGIHYRNKNVSKRVAYALIIGQALLNALAIGFGWAIDSFGDFVQAIFLSISAGTFLAISTMEMLGTQLHRPQFRWQKFLILVLATAFVSSIWFFENAVFSPDEGV